VRRRIFSRISGNNPQPLLTVSKQALVEAVARTYNAIRDFNATVNLTPALGSAEKSKITEYKEVRGYILFRKPSSIRMIGLYPVVRTTAFDMASDGVRFSLYIPSKNRFVVGRNDAQEVSANKLENLRPQHFLEGMQIRPIEDSTRVLLENFTDEDNAFYILHELQEKSGQLLLRRTIWFERTNLTIVRQIAFDDSGDILSDARYDEWRSFDNVLFPRHVVIDRPREEYGVIVDIVKMDINKGLKDDQFALAQPEGSTLQVMGNAPATGPANAASPARK
jgi:outer membrane lipoprotein-sorting protein